MPANRRAQSWDVCVWIRPLTIGYDYRGRARGRRKSARRVNGLLRAVCPFHLPWGCPDDSRLQWQENAAAKVRCCTCRRLAWVGCSRNVMLAEKSVERPLGFFSFSFFFLFWWTCFTTSSCLACKGFPEEAILWDQVSRKGSWALRS